ncbi:MAG: 5-(carboxyamino)imidazole ribonucleotide mutase [Spirochaetales bacterium]|nr:5-(carboxyamino)imidazole ribonucleotide mutase [Spirochaetales bacterium]
MKKVAIIMGSDSDLPVVQKTVDRLVAFNIPYTCHVFSAHRTPIQASQFAKDAINNGYGVIVSVAGMAAHLGGVLASYTTLPIIGIPVAGKTLDGMDALFSTVQMPPGVPVASMAINGGENAAVFAAQILALNDEELREKLVLYKANMEEKVLIKNKDIEEKYNG